MSVMWSTKDNESNHRHRIGEPGDDNAKENGKSEPRDRSEYFKI